MRLPCPPTGGEGEVRGRHSRLLGGRSKGCCGHPPHPTLSPRSRGTREILRGPILANSLTVGRLNAGYGAVRVLEEISLAVSHAETVVLLGTNGNGKSTLMKCIMGMVRPSSGEIVAEIDGARYDLVGRATEEIVDLG